MTAKPERDRNWNLATWKGSRLPQPREFHALPNKFLELFPNAGLLPYGEEFYLTSDAQQQLTDVAKKIASTIIASGLPSPCK